MLGHRAVTGLPLTLQFQEETFFLPWAMRQVKMPQPHGNCLSSPMGRSSDLRVLHMQKLLRASLLAMLSKLFLETWLPVGMALDPTPRLVNQLAPCVCALILFSAKAEPKTRTWGQGNYLEGDFLEGGIEE